MVTILWIAPFRVLQIYNLAEWLLKLYSLKNKTRSELTRKQQMREFCLQKKKIESLKGSKNDCRLKVIHYFTHLKITPVPRMCICL